MSSTHDVTNDIVRKFSENSLFAFVSSSEAFKLNRPAIQCFVIRIYRPTWTVYWLCYVVLCYAMLCYVMLCYAMLCYAMLCYAMLAMLCYAMLCCYVMSCHVFFVFVFQSISRLTSTTLTTVGNTACKCLLNE